MNELVGGLGYAVKNWWMSLLLGLLYIAVALCLLFAPVSSYVALSVIFSISILVSGILEIFFAVGNKKIINSWGWYLAGGIIDLLIGIYLVFYPLVSMELIPVVTAGRGLVLFSAATAGSRPASFSDTRAACALSRACKTWKNSGWS